MSRYKTSFIIRITILRYAKTISEGHISKGNAMLTSKQFENI